MWRVNWVIPIALISIGFMMPALSAAEEESRIEGMIEIDYPFAGEAKVEVNLAGALFALAAKVVRDDEPETSDFLANLKALKVRIYDRAALGEKGFDEVLKFYEEQLKKEKWDIMARVKEEGSKVGVYSLTKGDIVSGLIVLIGEPGEVVIVNLAGNIDVTKLSQIDKITGMDLHLSDLDKKGAGDSPHIEKDLPPNKQKKQVRQRERALKSFWDGKSDEAIALLEELEKEGISDPADYALMAVLYNSTGAVDKSSHYLGKLRDLKNFRSDYALLAVLNNSMGAVDKSYYYLGRIYESEDLKDVSTAFYKKAVEINPQSEAAERLSGN
jgi:tetratricopeptide (TPR) repeat protein